MNVLVLYGTHEAPAIQDIYFNNPFKILEKEKGFNFNLMAFSQLSWSELNEHSLVIVSRIFDPEILDLISTCNRLNKKLLFFFDDDILHFPTAYYLDNEPFYKIHEELIISILQKSSALIVSTEKLKATYQQYNATIYVTPPCLNTNFVSEAKKGTKNISTGSTFTIGYAGSFGHVIDFRFMENALLQFYNKHYPKVKIEFMGCIPDAFSNKVDNDFIKLIHWQPDYEKYLRNVLNAQWHLALCPVLDSSYTSHKTAIKFLEYSAAEIPGIYSDISLYSGDVIDNKNGLLAKNTFDAWMNNLEYAYANRSSLPALARTARDYVLKTYSNNASAQNWKTILADYKKDGLLKVQESISIKLHKAKKLYSKGGVQSVARKLTSGYLPLRLPQASRNGQATGHLQTDMLFSDLEKNFDSKVIKKQVLFIVPWLSVGGGDMVNLNIAHTLDSRKYTLHFITTEISKHEWEGKFRSVTKNIFHVRQVIEEATHFWEYNNLILEYIKRAHIDTIILSNSAIGYTCLPAIKEKSPHIRILDVLHGQGGSREGGGFPEFSKPYDDFIDVRITINNYLKSYMIERYGIEPSKMKVIHNGIDVDRYKRSKSGRSSTFTVTYVGRLSYEKHPEHIIAIAEQALKLPKKRDINFEIIGDGPMYKDLERRIESKGLGKRIKLKGYKDNIKQQLEQTHVLLLCSEIEGLPIVLLEAMSMSVPCIASKVGGIPELIDDGHDGYLIDYNEGMIEKFAERVVELCNNETLFSSMARNARAKVAEQFSGSVTQAYEALINE